MTFKTSDFVFSTNESIKKIALRRTNYPVNKTAIVRNGPDKDFQPSILNVYLKNDKKYLAAYIGVMGQTDGVEYIIYAAEHIVNELNRMIFILF